MNNCSNNNRLIYWGKQKSYNHKFDTNINRFMRLFLILVVCISVMLICYKVYYGESLIFLRAYISERIVVFKENTFISGFYEIEYSSIVKVEVLKEYNTYPENLVTIKFYGKDEYLGYDKLLLSEYNYLMSKCYNLS